MGAFAKPVICLVTPGTRDANNGNWRTAIRWAAMLRDRYRVIVQTQWEGARCDAMIALHAKRSAASVEAFHDRNQGRIAVVLSGTDLYRDLPASREAARSLDLAQRIVVLQEEALRQLAPEWRAKSEVIFQSARALRRRARNREHLDCVAVGHLRAEKDPATIFRAAARLPREVPLRIRHIGAALDADLAAAARALAAAEPRYRYLGPLPHGLVRSAIASAHVLIHPSVMEGGANVVVEAVTCGTPVIASRIPGNIGMLGPRYPGYFETGNDAELAGLLEKCCVEPTFLKRLETACRQRKPLFQPRLEAKAVRRLAASLLA